MSWKLVKSSSFTITMLMHAQYLVVVERQVLHLGLAALQKRRQKRTVSLVAEVHQAHRQVLVESRKEVGVALTTVGYQRAMELALKVLRVPMRLKEETG